jgi:thymidylate synthase
MFFRGIVEELLFFLRGETDSKILEAKNINIWRGNTSREFLDKHGFTHREEGDMGPMYGYQWRRFNGDSEKGDQLREVIHLLRHEKESRRILMTDYNPLQAKQGVLFPCHSIIIQFYVEGGYLDMFVYNRSSDTFLGLPFNIASSALLLEIIAKTVGLQARHLHMTLGDVHLYKNHLDVALSQLELIPCVLSRLTIKARLDCVEHIDNLRYEHFYLDGYVSHPSIKAEMVA